MSTRNIRFPKDKSLKLFRGNIVTREILSSCYNDDKITMKDVVYPIALRIFKYTDIDVETLNGWTLVKNNDVAALERAYSDNSMQEYGVKIVEEPVVEKNGNVDCNINNIDESNDIVDVDAIDNEIIEDVSDIVEMPEEDYPISEENNEVVDEINESNDEDNTEQPSHQNFSKQENHYHSSKRKKKH